MKARATTPAVSPAHVLATLRALANPVNVAGQRRFGITPKTEQLGLGVVTLRRLARSWRRQHTLALALWDSGVHEARVLATMIDDPEQVTTSQMNRWAASFDSWDVCDQCCGNLFDRTPWLEARAFAWARSRAEYVKRAGFVLMATSAIHRKELPDEVFLGFLEALPEGAKDERNFVRKGVNWALRQIGKRNPALRREALACAERILKMDTKAARWIARDALRELRAR